MISKNFLLAGNATFTVSNPEGAHYTFKVYKSDVSTITTLFFIKVLTGADNENSYTYLGMINPTGCPDGVRLTKASKYNRDTLLYKVANWSVRKIMNGYKLPEGYKIDHAGSCGRCGRKLTTPSSIKLGLGPVCAELS